MNVERFIRLIQITSVLIILTGAIIGFVSEINLMVEKMKVDLADLLLLFIYVEVMGMIRVYLLNEEIRITYPLIIAITAISRLIILQKKALTYIGMWRHIWMGCLIDAICATRSTDQEMV